MASTVISDPRREQFKATAHSGPWSPAFLVIQRGACSLICGGEVTSEAVRRPPAGLGGRPSLPSSLRGSEAATEDALRPKTMRPPQGQGGAPARMLRPAPAASGDPRRQPHAVAGPLQTRVQPDGGGRGGRPSPRARLCALVSAPARAFHSRPVVSLAAGRSPSAARPAPAPEAWGGAGCGHVFCFGGSSPAAG